MADLAQLHSMIEAVLAGRLSFRDFDSTFGFIYYELPVEVMRSTSASLVSDVVEKREFITENPSAADRLDGWIDQDEFLTWLRRLWDQRSERPLSNDR